MADTINKPLEVFNGDQKLFTIYAHSSELTPDTVARAFAALSAIDRFDQLAKEFESTGDLGDDEECVFRVIYDMINDAIDEQLGGVK